MSPLPADHKLLRLLYTAAIIVAVSAAFAFTVNALRGSRLPLIRPSTVPPEEGGNDPWAVGLAKARQLYDQGVLFIDSRTPEEYGEGHILGARLLYYDHADAEWETVLQGVDDMETPLVVYCSGEGCNSSQIVADLLRKVGYNRVYLFHAGWPAWSAAGYPIEGKRLEVKLYEFGQ